MEASAHISETQKTAGSPNTTSHGNLPAYSGEPRTPGSKSSTTRLSELGLDLSDKIGHPGNAFAVMKARGIEHSKLPRKSTGSSNPDSPIEDTLRPSMSRKLSSGLDYNEELALPMPKPRHSQLDSGEEITALGEETIGPHLLKKRVISEPCPAKEIPIPEPPSPGDGKKKSRLEIIKSKLSFKDLRKEATQDEGRVSIPGLPATEVPRETLSSKPCVHHVNFADRSCAHQDPGPSPRSFILFPGGLAPSRALSSRRPGSWGSQRRIVPDPMASKDTTGTSSKTERRISVGSNQPDIVVTRSSPETPCRKQIPPVLHTTAPDYPPTGYSPPNASDLTEGTGKVKYLPKAWLEGFSPSPAPSSSTRSTPKRQSPTAYAENEPPVTSLPNYMSSFSERLDKANLPLDKPISAEIRNRSTATHVDNIVDMVRSIQRQADSGTTSLNKKLEELSSWIGDQLKNQIEGIGDLSRANSDLHSRQYEISREMMKFQLDIRLEIGVMERRLNVFEMRVMDELQAEVRSLARSYEELNQKTENLIAKHSSDDNQKFIDYQHQKNAEIENEIAYLKNQREASISIPPFSTAPQAIPQTQQRQSESSTASAEPLIKQADLLAPSGPHSVPTSPARSRVVTTALAKSGIVFPRSVSFTKRGLRKSMRDTAPTVLESEEQGSTNEESKKWNVFGLRRRRNPSDSSASSTGKFSWAYSRRLKDAPTPDNGSSRSSTPPVPPIPVPIIRAMQGNLAMVSVVHPAFRNPVQKAPMDDGSPSSPASAQRHSESASSNKGGEIKDNGAKQAGVKPVSPASTPTCSPDNKPSTTEFLAPDVYHDHPEACIRDSVAIRQSIEDMQNPLLGDADEESPDWDRVSGRSEVR
ncbi:hypothetical protein N7462_005054 [Penicillium macrosclerotiorum]|uniref:uncharacterized protein n=1 Tax=Penicillium macrosclerotiorum TaxID=303699 RepID=UPI0025487821|nr:uncharacterized protein N7462_005054 [Penicillium macrosclerotiorum]KAJ5690662.1 hypothetical protein N7462_005054 [Penicillium macrosclerotiorum]